MAMAEDYEDVVSFSLTAVSMLLDKFNIHPGDIGRLEVGTESAADRSKSIKSFLMPLFASHGNFDLPVRALTQHKHTNICPGACAMTLCKLMPFSIQAGPA